MSEPTVCLAVSMAAKKGGKFLKTLTVVYIPVGNK